MTTMYPQTKTVQNIPFTKHYRGGAYPWGTLSHLTDAQVIDALKAQMGDALTDEGVKELADFASYNPASRSFDYPEQDRLRALLGALNEKQITLG